MASATMNLSYLRLWRSGYNTFVMLKMSSSVSFPTIGVNTLEAVAKSNAVAYVDAIVVGGRWPERSALSWSWSWLYV